MYSGFIAQQIQVIQLDCEIFDAQNRKETENKSPCTAILQLALNKKRALQMGFLNIDAFFTLSHDCLYFPVLEQGAGGDEVVTLPDYSVG